MDNSRELFSGAWGHGANRRRRKVMEINSIAGLDFMPTVERWAITMIVNLPSKERAGPKTTTTYS